MNDPFADDDDPFADEKLREALKTGDVRTAAELLEAGDLTISVESGRLIAGFLRGERSKKLGAPRAEDPELKAIAAAVIDGETWADAIRTVSDESGVSSETLARRISRRGERGDKFRKQTNLLARIVASGRGKLSIREYYEKCQPAAPFMSWLARWHNLHPFDEHRLQFHRCAQIAIIAGFMANKMR